MHTISKCRSYCNINFIILTCASVDITPINIKGILISVSHSRMFEDSNLLVNVAVPVSVFILTFRLVGRMNHTVVYPRGLKSCCLASVMKGIDDSVLRFVFLGF